ncbi:DUF4938 domain-containing protein [Candidatus Viridilinea mediisalina]|nr:DUF4938 domain-containing protein [Candidatus Viridilinea mediisalina]
MPPMQIIRLRAYAGPNILGPVAGVWLLVHCDQDRSTELRGAIKDAAQAIGLVLARLEVDARPLEQGAALVSVLFSCEVPTVGAALCEYVVACATAKANADATWDREAPLAKLQRQRRSASLPMAAVQLMAEALQRGLPSFVSSSGHLQLGYGARGWQCDLAELGEAQSPPTPPWEHLGSVPLVLVTGAHERTAAVQRLAADTAALGVRVHTMADASFALAREALADPQAEALVLGLETNDILRYGLPCDRCDLAVITDRAGPRPDEATDDDEWVRALGIPMLLSAQPVRLKLSDARLLPLVPYAPNGVVDWPSHRT